MKILSLAEALKVPLELEGYIMHSSPSLEVIHLCLKPGQDIPQHANPFDALVQVMSGNAEIVINGKPNQLAAGQSIIMPANISHAVNANERFIMLLTMIRE